MNSKNILGMLLIFVFATSTLALTDELPLYEEFVLERGILRKGIFEEYFVNYLKQIKGYYEHHFVELIQKNPNPAHPANQNLINHLILWLEPLCILALLIVGLYLILLSGTAWGRAFSKSLVPGLIAALVLIPVSSYFMYLFLEISHSLTSQILSFSPHSVGPFSSSFDYLTTEFSHINDFSSLFSLPFLFLALSLPLLTIILLVIRYILVNFFIIFIPATVFLYLFLPTRGLGKRLLELTISWTLVQMVVAIAFVSISGTFFLLPSLPQKIRVGMEVAANLTLIFVILGTGLGFRNYLPG